MTASATNGSLRPFTHVALPYRRDAEYLSGAVPFIMKGLADDEPVLAAVSGDQLELLRGELGRGYDDVTTLDMTKVGRNPGRIIPTVLLAFADAHRDRRVRILAEPMCQRPRPDEYPEYVRHEALINRAFADRCAIIMCPYDVAHLPRDARLEAARTHPVLVEHNDRVPSSDYAPEAVLAATNVPLPPVRGARGYLAQTADMTELRRLTTGFAQSVGLGRERIQDLVLALTELASNSIEHAYSSATVLLGIRDGRLVGQVRDRGHIADPLAGRHPAPPSQSRGRGLLLVNQLADLVRMHSTPGGTTVEIQFDLPTFD